MVGATVAVTGANGFIASWLVKLLLERGYIVRGTLRDPGDAAKVGHLLKLPGAKDRLVLSKANLLREGDFDDVFDGVDGVFHTASPVPPTTPLDIQEWYSLSKTQAEQAAWDFAKENALDLVVLNPAMVVGPLLQNSINSSCKIILDYLNGSKDEIPNRLLPVVHVKDVAMAHVLAFENPTAEGRYLLVEKGIHSTRLVELLKVLCPRSAIPDKYTDNEQPMAATFCSDKARKLGVVFTPAEEAIRDCVESFKERNWVEC